MSKVRKINLLRILYRQTFWLYTFFIIGLLLRIYSLNWDQSQHLHPDERFLTMVVSDIRLPETISKYFDTQTSLLNPNNRNYSFYVYGTFPLLITRIIGETIGFTTYDNVFLLGRLLSAFFDALIIVLIFKIGKLLKFSKPSLIISIFIYTFAFLPIQLSHFFTVDTFTSFFSILTLFLFIRYLKNKDLKSLILSGSAFGLTLANKTSIGISLPLFGLMILAGNFKLFKLKTLPRFIKTNLLHGSLFLIFAFLLFRTFQPYAFDSLLKLSPKFIHAVKVAHEMITGEYNYPPNVQWYGSLPILHPLFNIFAFGLGPLTTALSLLGIFHLFYKRRFKIGLGWLLLLLFFLEIFIYQGIQHAKYMRYFYPVYPILVLLAADVIPKVVRSVKFQLIILFFILFHTILFIAIYSRPNARVEASQWICQNIPFGSTLSNEVWDDSLPLSLNPDCNPSRYSSESLALYDEERPEKWVKIYNSLSKIDYLIMSSNRLWGSIPKQPLKYPVANRFYQDLFDGRTPFKMEKVFYSYPGITLPFQKSCLFIGPENYPSSNPNIAFITYEKSCDVPGIYLRDDIAEESFSVYDHPKVIIFKKQSDNFK